MPKFFRLSPSDPSGTLEEWVRRAGLSISIVNLSELIGAKRLDAEAYQPAMLNAYAVIEHLPHISLGQAAFITDGQHGYHTIDESSEIKHLTAQCIQNGFINAINADRISEEMHSRNQRSACEEGDVLLSTAGTIGNSGIVTQDVLPANMDQDVARIKIHSKQELNPWYLVAFLNSRYGRLQTTRESTGQVQQHLALEKVRQLRIPLLAKQDKIAEKSKLSFELFQQSEKLYAEAERLLSAELGLDRLDLRESLFNVRHMSDVMNAGRVDAEYFKPKYERLLEYLQATGQSVRVNEWVREPLKRGVQPEYSDEGEILVINSQHVGKAHVELEDNRRTTKEFCAEGSNKRAIVHKNDVLMNSTGYITIGRAQTLLENVQAMVDGHVTIIRPKDGLDPVYLGLFLNSRPGQLQTERGWTGSSGQIELRTDVIGNFLVWKAPMSIQLKIRELVENAHQDRQDAKRLLAEAKAEVERLIENGG